VWEEKSVFRQQPEMLQEKWSWRESKEGKTEREFNLDQIEMGGRIFWGSHFIIRPNLPVIAKWFIHAPDSHIWLTDPKPATFLRWEGPIVMPSDPTIRVDLISDERSRPAELIKTADRE
jgi:hypothetical protein